MLSDKSAMATIAVRKLEPARKFYEETLGLKSASKQQPGTWAYETGGSRLLVYESQFAGTNKATTATWVVGDEIEAVVRDLQVKGATFEKYDFPGMTFKNGIHEGMGGKVAWLKDPDGNILSLVGG